MDQAAGSSLEARVRRTEDMLEIYNLIATHPPMADTGATVFIPKLWADDAFFTRSDGQGTITLEDMMSKSQGPEHRVALEHGLAHFGAHPWVHVDGDSAVAISYLQLLTHRHDAPKVELSGHGSSRGFLTMKVVVNRWILKRTDQGWRVLNRVARSLDGSPEARELLMTVADPAAAG